MSQPQPWAHITPEQIDPDDDRVTQMDVAAMTDAALAEFRDLMVQQALEIDLQLQRYKVGAGSPNWDDTWRRGAVTAAGYRRAALTRAKIEMRRRHAEREALEDPERIKGRAAAFVMAAKALLPPDTFMAIWAEARSRNPNLFAEVSHANAG